MISHPPFPDKQYQILYADPPWDYKGQLQHTGVGGKDSGGAVRHYPTISVKEMLDWNIASGCYKTEIRTFSLKYEENNSHIRRADSTFLQSSITMKS